MKALLSKLSYANVMATFAVFLALGGGAYAATQLPKNSVGTKQLKKGSVTGVKIKDGTITGAKIDGTTLGIVPAAVSADRATSASRATNADRAGHSDEADHALEADNAKFLNGSSSGEFVHTNQVGFIDKTFTGCSLVVLCDENLLTIAGINVRAICETGAGTSSIQLYPEGSDETGYSFVRGTTEARHGQFNGTQSFLVASTTSNEALGATGTVVMRTPLRIITLSFNATTRAPTVNTAACTLHATALAV
jgi:hypothetical protein